MKQVQLDINSLERAIKHRFSPAERETIQKVQESSYQQVFLISGITHPNFVQSVEAINPEGYSRILAMAKAFSQG